MQIADYNIELLFFVFLKCKDSNTYQEIWN